MPQLKWGDPIGEIIRVVATLLVLCGLVSIWIDVDDPRSRQYSERGTYGGVLDHRFQKDNAVDATANAVEWIAKHTSPPLVGDAIWVGLALWVIASLRRTRIAIERLADERAPMPPLKQKQVPATPTVATKADDANWPKL
ncbi:MAG: hypothetical protein ACKV2Q_18065 [Planctomycetaceae bacterium]